MLHQANSDRLNEAVGLALKFNQRLRGSVIYRDFSHISVRVIF